ncbi:hypothetical protein Rsub_07949 [Raphidocelis subcapitata]|uniref:CAAX prenyl protease 2/Lysostaphin resistance protein A-like domain-containing protein n=1 Tax=Raphidocelis subcapitata TaxID=307507 RepID=A0A2V0P5T1_9CHLO|nr:hypothetical protein Rsub_07949 [Raphidocelis subcapitata]|eukprot:GBF95234.1 hypothetical protein Rsub_07949 [Raphidocelis subcapitata]
MHDASSSGSSSSSGQGPEQQPQQQQKPSSAGAPPSEGPSFMDGINWFCYSALGLIILADFSPLGAVLASGPDAPLKLAAFQGAVFFAPTLAWVVRQGWDVRRAFRIAPASGAWLAAGLCLGPIVWGASSAAIALKSGAWAGGAGSLLPPDAAPGSAGTVLAAAAAGGASPVLLAAAVALAPALIEELLFRGLLLAALLTRLGRIDAVALCGALFAAIHLDPAQFFPFAVLGFAAGGVAVASRSVWPAVALHAAYNLTGLALGLALARA